MVRDFGVLIDNDLKLSSHIEAVVTKAHNIALVFLNLYATVNCEI